MGENLKALEEFYEYYKGKAGKDFQMDFGDFCRVCRTPFRFLKKEMTDGTLDPYRLQYLGTFTIPENRIKFSHTTLDNKLKDGLISERRYKERKQLLNRHVKEKHVG